MDDAVTWQILCSDPSQPQPVNSTFDEVRRLPLFDRVEKDLVGRLAPHFSARHYRPGTMVLQQGSMVKSYCTIVRGIVELVHVQGEQEHGVLLLSSGDLIMPAAATFDEPTLVSVRALTSLRALEIEAGLLRLALDHSSRLSNNLMMTMAGQWRMVVRNVLELNSRTAAQRLGAFLLRLSDLLSERGQPAVLPIAKRHLANRLGMTPETLSRTLQVVARHGLHLRGRSITIHDRTAIEDFCGPNPSAQADERPLNVFAI